MLYSRAINLPILFLTILFICPPISAKIERLILDFANLYSLSSIAIVNNREELEQPIVHQSVAFISYANFELQEVVSYINGIKHALDAVFFLGSDHSELVNLLGSSTDIFHSHVLSVMENHVSLDLHLRLDTNIIFYTPYNTNYLLSEKYAVKEGPIVEKHIGNFSQEVGLLIEIPHLWERRSDLKKIELIDTVLDYPVLRKFTKKKNGEILKENGIAPDILAVLQKRLNFSTKSVPPVDKKWGSIKDDNLTWSGMVGDLAYGRADISTALLSPSYERSDVIDFSITVFEYTVTLIQPMAINLSFNTFAYLTIFPLAAWIIIISMILISGFIIWCIAKYSHAVDVGLHEAIAISVLFLLQLSHDTPMLLKTNAAKVGLFTWAIGCYLVLSMYEADLTAFMTSGAQENDIKYVSRKKYTY